MSELEKDTLRGPVETDTITEVAPMLVGVGLKVCVFCSASELDDHYTVPAKEFARSVAEHGYTFVWGGSDSGLNSMMV